MTECDVFMENLSGRMNTAWFLVHARKVPRFGQARTSLGPNPRYTIFRSKPVGDRITDNLIGRLMHPLGDVPYTSFGEREHEV